METSNDNLAQSTVSYDTMFLVMGNTKFYETVIVDSLRTIAEALPPAWSLRRPQTQDARGADGFVELVGPTGETARFLVEAKRAGAGSATSIIDELVGISTRSSDSILFLSDYINPTLRSGLARAGISYADGTGWMRLSNAKPLVFLSATGATRSPRIRENSAITRLGGRATGRIIRALLETPVPLGVRALAEVAGTSPGSVSKLLPTLEASGAIDRDAAGAAMNVRKRALLERWTEDYTFFNSNSLVFDFVAPRGLAETLDRLRDRPDVSVTGSAAARTYLPDGVAPVTPLTQLTCFARDPQGLASHLQLERSGRFSANVFLTQPMDPELIDSASISGDRLRRVAVSQVLADLMSLPGRSEQEAEQLIEVLARTDRAWRT